MNKIQKHIASVEGQLSLNLWLKGFLLALCFLPFMFLMEDRTWWKALFGALPVIFAASLGAFKSQKKKAVQVLHERSGNMEFSLELLEKTNYSIGERLQLERISSRLPQRITVFSQGLIPYLIAVGVVILATALVFQIKKTSSGMAENTNFSQMENLMPSEEIPVLLSEFEVRIQSPAYTGIAATSQQNLEIEAYKGSQVSWELNFENSADLAVFWVNSLGEKQSFEKSDKAYLLNQELIHSGVYSIQAFKDSLQVFQSDFYRMNSLEDKAPEIIPSEKENYKYFFPGNNPKLVLKAKISDDFKVNQVAIVATLARGKGENVKFRETRIAVENSPFQSKNSSLVLDVSEMDFQPGDELYYYWTAIDNQRPEANSSRTDTFFIKYFDENDDSDEAMAGMAINVLPEYFRSQRQIIIDTEKLIAERKAKKKEDFNYTSNEIGYDQKLLRLRYGQYLGEEFESDAGGGELDAEGGDLLTGFMHLHDQEGEHDPDFHPAESHEEEQGHSHGEEVGPAQEGGIESLLSEYMHAHDSEDMNTYFEASTRGALKSALEQMWQAELYLRLFEPETSLPYQYKALEYLKTVQQKSRVYIKKTGYDPPPIKEEEKRLTGDLDEIGQRISKEQQELNRRMEPLASQVLGYLNRPNLGESEKQVIRNLGQLWTERLQKSGLDDWSVLVELQQLEVGKLDAKGSEILQEKLYPIAKSYKSVEASYPTAAKLKNAFRENLK